MRTIDHTTVLIVKTCGRCGLIYAVPDYFDEARRDDHNTFYCPNGHPRVYKEGESQAARVKRLEDRIAWERAQADQVRADRDALQRSLSATRGVVTRTKRRVGNGVCPCCNRTFQQLARHMSAKHPDYREESS